MSDPQTSGVGLYQPTRGSDVGTWDLPVNANAGAIDSLFTYVSTITLSNAPIVLTTPPNAGATWAGPYQSQSAVLRLNGTLSANVTVQLPRPGFYLVQNLCTVGNFAVVLASAAPGKLIGCPPGEAIHVLCDGTDLNYVNLGRIGHYCDLSVAAVPAWITACTVKPYLNCDGTTFSGATYPNLAAYLGGTTLPDLRGRLRATLNQGTGRISYSVDGNTLLAAGGDDKVTLGVANLPNYDLPIADPGHDHAYTLTNSLNVTASAGGLGVNSGAVLTRTGGSTTNITVASGGSDTPATIIPPIQMAGITLIRAG